VRDAISPEEPALNLSKGTAENAIGGMGDTLISLIFLALSLLINRPSSRNKGLAGSYFAYFAYFARFSAGTTNAAVWRE
jgi:NAD(P)H-hydrate repair Nnr-like enzyme with NAD(P)H-hydrate dehydratase domain